MEQRLGWGQIHEEKGAGAGVPNEAESGYGPSLQSCLRAVPSEDTSSFQNVFLTPEKISLYRSCVTISDPEEDRRKDVPRKKECVNMKFHWPSCSSENQAGRSWEAGNAVKELVRQA